MQVEVFGNCCKWSPSLQTAGFVPVQCWLEKGRVQNNIYMHICTYIMHICTHREAKVQLTTAAAIVLVTTGRQEFWLALEDKSTWWYLKAEILVTPWSQVLVSSTWGKSNFGV